MPKNVMFDEKKVLKKIRFLFRRKGYASTTMGDLTAETGLNPGSLYNSLGNKEEVFTKAVVSYNQIAVEQRTNRLLQVINDKPFEGLKIFMESTYRKEEKVKIGCLLTNSVSEMSILPKTSRKAVLKGIENLENAFLRYLEDEERINNVRFSCSREDTAKYLFVHYQGFLTLVKLKTSDNELQHYLENVFIQKLKEQK